MIINAILFMILGGMLALIGFPAYTWQYWAIMIYGMILYLYGFYKGKS